jgi:hypothetical protein
LLYYFYKTAHMVLTFSWVGPRVHAANPHYSSGGT